MSFCTSCGTANSGNGNFCSSCGMNFSTNASSESGFWIKLAKIPKNLVGSTSRKISQQATRVWRNCLRLLKPARKLAYLRNHPLRAGLVALAITYIGVFLTSFFWFSPSVTAEKYAQAIASKNVSILSDGGFFPKPEGVQVAPATILNAIRTKSAKFVVEQEWSPFSAQASATVIWADGEEFEIRLAARPNFQLGFLVREWQILNPGPVLSLAVREDAPVDQKFSIGTVKFDGLDDAALDGLIDRKLLVFPGTLRMSYSEYRFAANEVQKHIIPRVADEISIPIGPSYENVPGEMANNAKSEADIFAITCSTRKCSKLPSFYDYEFSWDDDMRDYELFYDSKTESTSYSVSPCEISGLFVHDINTSTVKLTCDVLATRTETYIDYYYFLADDYSFYFGTATKTLTLNAKFKFDEKTQQIEFQSITSES